MRHGMGCNLRPRKLSGNPFSSIDAAYAFAFAMVVWILSEIIGGNVIPWVRRHGSRVQRRNRGSNTLVIVAWVAAFGVSAGFAGGGIMLLPDWFSYVGVVVILAGVALRQWAIAVLGRYFSGVIGVQEDQKVVDTGPYHRVRHPSYTGALLILAGIAASFRSIGAILTVILIFALVYGYRMVLEERVLVSELGDSYVEYMKRTKRIIPFIV
jgi:protein-S-isoprenylcysteine O-methyltransferase Ste14